MAKHLLRPFDPSISDTEYIRYRMTEHLFEGVTTPFPATVQRQSKQKLPIPSSNTWQLIDFRVQVSENDRLRLYDIKRYKGLASLKADAHRLDSKPLADLAIKIKADGDKICTLINQLKSLAASYDIHHRLTKINTMLVVIGNMYSMHSHEGFKKYLCSPDLVKSILDIKSTPYSRDAQFLAFTSISCIPSTRISYFRQ